MGGGVVFQRVISRPTEKTTGALAALMFKLPIQLFPMKLRLDPLLVKLHLNLFPLSLYIHQIPFLCFCSARIQLPLEKLCAVS